MPSPDQSAANDPVADVVALVVNGRQGLEAALQALDDGDLLQAALLAGCAKSTLALAASRESRANRALAGEKVESDGR